MQLEAKVKSVGDTWIVLTLPDGTDGRYSLYPDRAQHAHNKDVGEEVEFTVDKGQDGNEHIRFIKSKNRQFSSTPNSNYVAPPRNPAPVPAKPPATSVPVTQAPQNQPQVAAPPKPATPYVNYQAKDEYWKKKGEHDIFNSRRIGLQSNLNTATEIVGKTLDAYPLAIKDLSPMNASIAVAELTIEVAKVLDKFIREIIEAEEKAKTEEPKV